METALAENPHLDTNAGVAENSHLGFQVVFAGMHPAIGEVKPNIASGIEAELRREGVRSRSTGKERDAETGLDNLGSWYLSAAQGRFTSPDPLGGHIEDPQTLNRYAYVRSNPTTLTDPTGLDF